MKAIRWIAVVLAVIAALAAVRYATGDNASATAQMPPPAPKVTVAQVLVRPVAAAQTYTGHLQAVNSVEVRPRVGGYITKVAFNQGAMVRKGQLLFRIDPRPYQAKVDQLKASLASARSALQLARANAARGDKLIQQHYISGQRHDALDSGAHEAAAKVVSILKRPFGAQFTDDAAQLWHIGTRTNLDARTPIAY